MSHFLHYYVLIFGVINDNMFMRRYKLKMLLLTQHI